MKIFTRVAVVVVGVLLLTLGMFAIPRSWAATDTATSTPPMASDAGFDLAPQAVRAISIPFGVESTLSLSNDSRRIQVVGHAECPEEMARFTVQAVAVQDAPGSYGTSPLTDEFTCQTGEGEQSWETVIAAQDTTTFVEGDAWVCVTSFFFPTEGETGVFRWCYEEIVLEAEQPEQTGRLWLPLITSSVLKHAAKVWQLLH